MKTRWIRTLVWIGAVTAAGALAGCGETTIKTADQPPTTQTSAAPSSAPTTGGGSGSLDASIGGAITLRGNDDGALMQVTALRVRDPASSSNIYIHPDPGNRYVGVRVRLRNVGTAAYSDSPSNGAKLVDRDDQEFSASVFDAVVPALGTLRIRPGDQRVGWITFEVPAAARPRLFQLTLDSGFGPETGEWRLR
jgi:hypothetical protein